MTAPMQRAVNAGAEAIAIHKALPRPTNDELARAAITAAYPHLFQALSRENRELRAEVARLNELLSPTQ